MTIEQKYKEASNNASDINQHIHTLRSYSEECNHITEMGVRGVVATWAFLAANPERFVCYDLERHANVDDAELLCIDADISFQFHEQDVLSADIEETDFLFIDTFHTGTQLEKELALHAGKVKRYIAFHDTHTFWEKGEPAYDGPASNCKYLPGEPDKGLRYAIEPFLVANPEWSIVYKTDVNNGLLIIKRNG